MMPVATTVVTPVAAPAAAPAATIVIFGALGDLTRRLLVPAIVNLARDGLLADAARIVGVGRHDGDDAMLRDALTPATGADDAWHRVLGRVRYLRGDFDDPATFDLLKADLSGAAIFYLAVPPDTFGPLVDRLGDVGLLDQTDGFRRVVIEKPFGHDLASAQALNAQILARLPEDRVYRIDHFLGKETVQNIMVARFGNILFERCWDATAIDHVQITVAEAVDVGTRGKFYDATGALRDMVPNHLFQLLALVGMEPPDDLSAEAVRTAKAQVIAAVAPVAPGDAVRGRYESGHIAGKDIGSYAQSDAVAPGSTTETYAALKVSIATPRWAGVPFYMRTGKAMAARDSEIVVQFKPAASHLYDAIDAARLGPNHLVLQLQPDEAMSLGIVLKKPGPVLEAASASMAFTYGSRFKVEGRTGYETLLYDVLIGDQTLFQRADQIEGGWRAIEPVIEAWRTGSPEGYAAGSTGPASADALLAADGRAWHALGSGGK